MKRILLIHPFIFSAISAIILYVSMLNVTVFIPPHDVILPSILAVIVGLIFNLIGFALTRDVKSAAVFASIFVIGLLYLWPLFLAVIGITILGILLIRIILKKVGFNEINLIMTSVGIFLSVYYLYQFIGFSIGQKTVTYVNFVQPVMASQEVTASSSQFPDIYYIILDGYGRADMLQTIHGYDNTAFIAELENRGFVVAQKSQANYPRTLLSVASTLNMQYLDSISDAMDSSHSWWPAGDIIQHSEIRQFLEQEGYQTVFISSGWDLTDIRDGTYYLKPYPIMLRNFQAAFISWTNLNFLSGFSQSVISLPSNENSRRGILYSFETLPEVSSYAGRKFIFAHILAPHPPFLFNSDGEPVDENFFYPKFGIQVDSENVSRYRRGYLEQLTYINRLTLEMIDGIRANSATPPVIILQGDHGPDVFMNYDDPHKACLYERYSILNAYYLPGIRPNVIPEDISPVNSFRLIFNLYFGTNVAMLPNHQYFSPNSNIYQFQDVTSLTEIPCDIPDSVQP